VTVQVTIADPDASDSGLRTLVRSVVYVQASDPISDLTACYVTDQNLGGTADLGWMAAQVATRLWRVRSEHILRSVRDVIIGYTMLAGSRKTQWYQWDGFDLEYDWRAPGADGSHLSAFHQIRKAMLAGQGADQRHRPQFGFSKS
jgi:hypothetical protein